MKLLILKLALVYSTLIQSAEVDNFTNRFNKLNDASEVINSKANEYLKIALKQVNLKNHKCKEKKLYKTLRKYFRNNYLTDFTPWIYTTDAFEKNHLFLRDNIYREFKWYQAPSVAIFNELMSKTFARSLNMKGHYIGSDKFEHFFGSGYAYFNRYYLKQDPLWNAIRIGLRAEHSILGATSTGVISYADMVANFNGMRFWNSMLAKRKDIFNESHGPYIECVNEKWVQKNKIDLSVFVDHGWDEAINCSTFRNNNLLFKILNEVDKLSEEYERDMTCPVRPDLLEDVISKYGSIGVASWIINPFGHRVHHSE